MSARHRYVPRQMLRKSDFKYAQPTTIGARRIRVIASDGTVDRVGDVLSPQGCDATLFKLNPICLFNHDVNQPIGSADVRITNAVEATIQFAPEGISSKADEVCGLAKSGVICGCSVGFNSTDYAPRPDGGLLYKSWTLLEISLVAVPCNPNAVVVERGIKGYSAVQSGDEFEGLNPFCCLEPATLCQFTRFVDARLSKYDALRCQFDAAFARRMFSVYQLTGG